MTSRKITQGLYDQIKSYFRRFDNLERRLGVGNGTDFVRYDEDTISFRNDASEAVPPFAAMEVTGAVVVGSRRYITIQKPTGDNSKPHIFNGAREVGIGKIGQAHYGAVDVFTQSAASPGDEFGVKDADWKLHSDGEPVLTMLGSFSASEGFGVPLSHANCDCGGSAPNYEVGWQFVSTETPVPPGAAIHRISHDYSTNICNESATETTCTITFENIHPTDPLVLSSTNYLQFSLIFGAIEDRTACNFNSISDGGTEELFQGGTPTKYHRRAKWTSGSVPAGGSITRTVAVNCTIEPGTLGSPAGTFESRVDYIVGGLGADPYSTRDITNTATCGS